MQRILIVEDERVLAKNFRDKLSAHGFEVKIAHTGRDALAVNDRFGPDLILLDVRLPDTDGITLLPKLRAGAPATSVIVMTAHGNERIAVDAMKGGAAEYLSKPIDLDELLLVVGRVLDHQQVTDNLTFLRDREQKGSGLDQIVGDSAHTRKLKETIRRLARTEVLGIPDPPAVLLTGETGTGKDLAARAIHYHGPRAKKPFIQVNCTALPATLFESELFGHLRGAFTSASQAKRGLFEVAHGGTIFLDEIGHMKQDMQAKLLLAVDQREIRPVGATETRPINVHVIAATNRDLSSAVEAGEFRSDLYHRLRVVHIHLTPLRERRDDIPVLASHFLALHCRRFGVPAKTFSDDAMEAARTHEWRGNVRELSHVIESTVLQVDGGVIQARDLCLTGVPLTGDFQLHLPGQRVLTMDFDKKGPTLEEIEQAILFAAYEHKGRNLSQAARALGITREALRYRLNKMTEAPESES